MTLAAIPVAVGGVTAATLLLSSAPASATSSLALTDNCELGAPLSGDTFAMDLNWAGTAPATAEPNSVLSGSGTAQPWTVPSDEDGNTVSEISNWTVTLVVSSNATIETDSISGGSNLGAGTPSITGDGNDITINIPGPIAAGTIVTLPTVDFTLKAGSTAGTVSVALAGSSYTDPGTTVTGALTEADGTQVVTADTCYPTSATTLTDTTVL
jgi:dehydratase